MTFDPATVVKRSEGLIATEIDGEVVIVALESGRYYGLDPVGSEIWRRLEAPKSLADLCTELTGHFDGDPATIERETLDFVREVAGRDILRRA